MKLPLRFVFLCLLIPATLRAAPKAPHFSFHLHSEPHKIDPMTAQGSASNYLYTNLFRGLFSYDPKEGLRPEGAISCKQAEMKLTCKLNPTLKWSNGEEVTAYHYLAAFRRLASPTSKSPQVEALLSLKNAKPILQGKLPVKQLGVSATDKLTLIFSFEKSDPEFKYKLSLPALAPYHSTVNEKKPDQLISNGPYMIKSWKKGRVIQLVPNPYYTQSKVELSRRPSVDVYFVDDDSTALNLYESGRLKFLRRLVTDKIDSFRSRADFYQFPMARFDYLGFGPRFKEDPQSRKALAQSLNYKQLAHLYRALGPPGCPSLSPQLQDQVHCHLHQPKKALKSLETSNFKKAARLTLAYSKMGGEDIKKGMEWVQNQWKTSLGIEVDLMPQEQGYYLQQLKINHFDVFRKGLGLDRPTCLAALEIFLPEHPENYIKLNDSDYNQAVDRVSKAKNPKESMRFCSEAIKILVDRAYIIPLGEIHFSVLASPEFSGWTLNELNQLDLAHLQYSSSKKNASN